MKKVLMMLVLIISMNVNALNGLAETRFTIIEIRDPNGYITKAPYYDSNADSVQVLIDTSRVKPTSVRYTSYAQDSTFTKVSHTKTMSASSYGWTNFSGLGFNGEFYYEGILYDSSGREVLGVKIHITDLDSPVNDSESGGTGEDLGEGPKENQDEKVCEMCEIFSCPGWDEYMNKLDEIKNAIPPTPNWNKVADIFRDSIAPQIKSDMAELIGTTENPVLPSDLRIAPSEPMEPNDLESLDTGNIEDLTPKGQEVQGLDDVSFDSNDIKDNSQEIEFEEDPTGGFEILDPNENLPSIEEFQENIPKEEENKAPLPSDSGTAPLPSDSGTAPLPSDSGTAPLPSDSGTAPLPNEG